MPHLRPLLIGQAPGRGHSPLHPLFPLPRGSAGHRLQQMSGWTRSEYIKCTERVNLIAEWPGRGRGGEDRFPMREARLAADQLRPELEGRRVLLVGKGVAQAFGFHHKEPFAWHGPWAWIHHPSGLSRTYNDGRNRLLVRCLFDLMKSERTGMLAERFGT